MKKLSLSLFICAAAVQIFSLPTLSAAADKPMSKSRKEFFEKNPGVAPEPGDKSLQQEKLEREKHLKKAKGCLIAAAMLAPLMIFAGPRTANYLITHWPSTPTIRLADSSPNAVWLLKQLGENLSIEVRSSGIHLLDAEGKILNSYPSLPGRPLKGHFRNPSGSIIGLEALRTKDGSIFLFAAVPEEKKPNAKQPMAAELAIYHLNNGEMEKVGTLPLPKPSGALSQMTVIGMGAANFSDGKMVVAVDSSQYDQDPKGKIFLFSPNGALISSLELKLWPLSVKSQLVGDKEYLRIFGSTYYNYSDVDQRQKFAIFTFDHQLSLLHQTELAVSAGPDSQMEILPNGDVAVLLSGVELHFISPEGRDRVVDTGGGYGTLEVRNGKLYLRKTTGHIAEIIPPR